MKTIFRRLGQLEARFVSKADQRMRQLADELQERRRRRLEASGQQPEPELDWSSLSLPPGRRLSCAETLRFARQLRLKRNRDKAEREMRAPTETLA